MNISVSLRHGGYYLAIVAENAVLTMFSVITLRADSVSEFSNIST